MHFDTKNYLKSTRNHTAKHARSEPGKMHISDQNNQESSSKILPHRKNYEKIQDQVAYLKVWLRLLFKVFFTWKYIKIIFFFILKKLFLTSAYQNNLKPSKNINLK